MQLQPYSKNPILKPIKSHEWESKAVFNPGVIYLGGKIHLIYRAMSEKNESCLGYAKFSANGYTLEERLEKPIYTPKEIFEIRITKEGKYNGNVGCEDPRITLIGEKIYMCYTAVNNLTDTRIALTSIKKKDFLAQKWNWEKPILISPPEIGDKNGCVIPLFKRKYAFFHRIYPGIWIDIRDSLKFKKDEWILGKLWIKPREGMWDSRKIGIAGPPLKIKQGWLLIYHGISEKDKKYRLGAAILDKNDPRKILYRGKNPILEPEKKVKFLR
jgi:predicted GH43/DUF377 family glycosyl hydrolase